MRIVTVSRACIAGLLGIAALSASAQTYRCGNTFSQVPCAPDAKLTRAAPAAASGAASDAEPAAAPRGADLCTTEGVRRADLPDPDSTRVLGVARGRADSIDYAGKPTLAHRFDVRINTRNEFGAYAGESLLACYVSEDEARLLKVVVVKRR